MNRIITITVAAATTTVLALTGCTILTPAPEPVVSSAPVETTAPEFDPADLDQDGTVTAWEQGQYDRKQPREYTKADGTTSIIVYGEPLPEDVKQDIAQQAGPAIPAVNQADFQPIRDYLDAKSAEIGRPVVLVFAVGSEWVAMQSGKKFGLFNAKASVDEAVAAAGPTAEALGAELIVVR